MFNFLRGRSQPEHERLDDEIMTYVLSRRIPPRELVAAAERARAAAREKAQNEAAGASRPSPQRPSTPRRSAAGPADEPRSGRGSAPAATASAWPPRELKRVAAIRAYLAERGLSPSTRQKLQAYAAELNRLAQAHGYLLVCEVACSLSALLENAGEHAQFGAVDSYLTSLRALLRADVRGADNELGRALVDELSETSSRLINLERNDQVGGAA